MSTDKRRRQWRRKLLASAGRYLSGCLLVCLLFAGKPASVTSRHQQSNATKRQQAEQTLDRAAQLPPNAPEENCRATISALTDTIAFWQQTDEPEVTARTYNEIGRLHVILKEYDLALNAHRQALGSLPPLKSPALRADILMRWGQVHLAIGGKNQEKAIPLFTQALEEWKKVRDTRSLQGLAQTLKLLALTHSLLNEKAKAQTYYEQSLKYWDQLEFPLESIDTRYNLGTILHEQGESIQAVTWLSEALRRTRTAAKTQSNPRLTLAAEIRILNNLGVALSATGEPEKALDHFTEGLALSEYLQDPKDRACQKAAFLTSIGFIYSALGDKDEAFRHLEKALPLRQWAQDVRGEAYTLNNLGALELARGNKEEALQDFKLAREKWRGQSDTAGEALALNNLGVTESELGNHQRALTYLEQALALRKKSGRRRETAATLLNLGLIRLATGEMQSALNTLEKALPLAQAAGDRNSQALALHALARIEHQAGNSADARKHIEQSLALIESNRQKLEMQELRASYLASVQEYYEFYVDLLMAAGKRRENQGAGLQASERARARVLLEMLQEARADLRGNASPDLLVEERRLQSRINATLGRQLLALDRSDDQQALRLRQELDELVTQQQRLRTEIRRTSPRYAALTQPQPVSVHEIQQEALDADTVLLEYALGAERSYLWVLTHNNIFSYPLPARTEIEQLARNFHGLLASDPTKTRPGQVFGQASQPQPISSEMLQHRQDELLQHGLLLSKLLLAPAAAHLAGKRLLIVPDGALHYLPFAALPELRDGKSPSRAITPLIAGHEIITLPSATTLVSLRRELAKRVPAPRNIALIADAVFDPRDSRIKTSARAASGNNPSPQPSNRSRVLAQAANSFGAPSLARLPFTRQEAERIYKLASPPSRQWLDFDASRAIATNPQLGEYRIVHFATHGFLNAFRPELSGLVLSLVTPQGQAQDGFLLSTELFSLKFPAELVVLSACETALGKEVRGEGIVGLTRGMMYAGAKRVLVSLWSVSDSATAELMEKFYEQMFKEGLKPAAAFRLAQLALAKDPRRQDPYYWAGFTLQGEW